MNPHSQNETTHQTQPSRPWTPDPTDARDFEIREDSINDLYHTITYVIRPPYGPLLPPGIIEESGEIVEARRTRDDFRIIGDMDDSRDFYKITLTKHFPLNLHLVRYRPPYGPLLPEAMKTDRDPGAFLIEERCASFESSMLEDYEWEYGMEFDVRHLDADHNIGDSEDESDEEFGGAGSYYDGKDGVYYGSESDLAEGDDVHIAEGRACGLGCGREVDVQFYGCFHTICALCFKQLWWSRCRRGKTYPRQVPCPFCRLSVRKVGTLSRESSAYGFGDEVGGDLGLTVWEWKPVRRWMITESKRAGEAVHLYYYYRMMLMIMKMNRLAVAG